LASDFRKLAALAFYLIRSQVAGALGGNGRREEESIALRAWSARRVGALWIIGLVAQLVLVCGVALYNRATDRCCR
jgi:hypothetical protein